MFNCVSITWACVFGIDITSSLLVCVSANCTRLAGFGLTLYCSFVLVSSGSSVSIAHLLLELISDVTLMWTNLIYSPGSCSSCVISTVLSFLFSVSPVICSVTWLLSVVYCSSTPVIAWLVILVHVHHVWFLLCYNFFFRHYCDLLCDLETISGILFIHSSNCLIGTFLYFCPIISILLLPYCRIFILIRWAIVCYWYRLIFLHALIIFIIINFSNDVSVFVSKCYAHCFFNALPIGKQHLLHHLAWAILSSYSLVFFFQ